MATTWTTEGTVASGWETQAGVSLSAVTTSATNHYLDNIPITFGTDSDFTLLFDTTDSHLEFNNSSGTRIASLSSTGLYLDQVNFLELSSLPGSATEGRMVYYNNEYYLGVGS